MNTLTEIGREVHGHDATAINRHSTLTYQDKQGKRYLLSRTLDGVPPFFEAYGPYTAEFTGAIPHLKIKGKEYWGNGWGWDRAVRSFLKEIGAALEPGRKSRGEVHQR